MVGAPCADQGRVEHVSQIDTGGRRKPYNRIRPFGNPISRYGHDHELEFGEIWLSWGPRNDPSNESHPGNIRFKVAFTERLGHHAARIAKLVPKRIPIHYMRVASSLQELARLQHRIGKQIFGEDPVFDPGGDPNMSDIDAIRNLVVIYLGDYSDEAAAAIRARYGPEVCVPAHDSPAPVPG